VNSIFGSHGRLRAVRISTVPLTTADLLIEDEDSSGCTAADYLAQNPGAMNNIVTIQMSPRTPEGLRSTGFAFSLLHWNAPAFQATDPTPGTGGFTVDIYRFVEEAFNWVHFKQVLNVNYNDLMVCADVNGGLLGFIISNVAVAGDTVMGLSFQEQ
jgi:hypothetical protein